jgi:hypothetical protein
LAFCSGVKSSGKYELRLDRLRSGFFIFFRSSGRVFG